MDLFEYQGKQYFARFDIPVSPGGAADTVDEAVKVADASGYPVVVKAQVQVGGRGKAGGIKCVYFTGWLQNQWVDFCQVAVTFGEATVQLHQN